MTIEDLGNIGELIAAVGVIISLIYLAVQLRSNTLALRADSRDKNFGNFIAANHPALLDKELMRIWLDGLEGTSALDREDAERFDRMLMERLIYIQLLFVRGAESGDPLAPVISRNLLEPLLRSPAGLARVENFAFRPEFKRFVDSLLGPKGAA